MAPEGERHAPDREPRPRGAVQHPGACELARGRHLAADRSARARCLRRHRRARPRGAVARRGARHLPRQRRHGDPPDRREPAQAGRTGRGQGRARADATRPPPGAIPATSSSSIRPIARATPHLRSRRWRRPAGWQPGAVVTVELGNNEDIVPPRGLRGDRRAALRRGQDRDPAARTMTLTAPLYMLRHGETAWNTRAPHAGHQGIRR